MIQDSISAKMKLLTIYLVTMGIFSSTYGFKHFQSVIPNGERVPHPCKPNYIWKGVGHKNEQGGGSRNPFGKDFEENGKKWDKPLCQRDSDGDGKTNGEELGDPDCTWTQGTIPKSDTGLSHPGVCEPVESDKCKAINTWEFCDSDELECPAIEKEGVKNMTLNLPPTPVPNQETTYICQSFDIPTDRDYHLIASKPFIDNEYVMHHILAFGCPEESMALRSEYNEPKVCGMGAPGCDLLRGWTLGSPGDCMDDHVGYRFGNTSYKFIMLQLHWNNPELRGDYTDSSGLTFFYTDELRQYDAATLTVGPRYLEIPPGATAHHEEHTCGSDCSSRVNGSMFIVKTNLHMHYLGRSSSLEHHRDGQKVQDLAVDEVFSYDSPVDHLNDNIEFKPGDELKLTCTYSSTSKTETTYYGDDTSAEMCFAFVTYYPAQAGFQRCVGFKSHNLCQIRNPVGTPPGGGGCEMEKFISQGKRFFGSLMMACPGMTCTEDCKKMISQAKKHPCLAGDAGEFLEVIMDQDGGDQVLALLDICEEKQEPEEPTNGERTYHQRPLTLMIASVFVWIFLIHRN